MPDSSYTTTAILEFFGGILVVISAFVLDMDRDRDRDRDRYDCSFEL
tara:strand:- start:691 stop:831 length:141 start_codon:yes stop_codon:yes gene_type:complete